MLPFATHLYGQCGHTNGMGKGRAPKCVRKCRVKYFFSLPLYGQSSHEYGYSVLSCILLTLDEELGFSSAPSATASLSPPLCSCKKQVFEYTAGQTNRMFKHVYRTLLQYTLTVIFFWLVASEATEVHRLMQRTRC